MSLGYVVHIRWRSDSIDMWRLIGFIHEDLLASGELLVLVVWESFYFKKLFIWRHFTLIGDLLLLRLQVFDFLIVQFLLLFELIHVGSIEEHVGVVQDRVILYLTYRLNVLLFCYFFLRWDFNFNTFDFNKVPIVEGSVLLLLNFFQEVIISFHNEWLFV